MNSVQDFVIENHSLRCYRGQDSRVSIPYGVTEIRRGVFLDYQDSLKEVIIPETVTKIPVFLFWKCKELQSVTLPDSLISIGAWAFDGCAKLEIIILPKHITKIEDGLFSDCENLKQVTLPEKLACIDYKVFSDCSNLTEVILPEQVDFQKSYFNPKNVESPKQYRKDFPYLKKIYRSGIAFSMSKEFDLPLAFQLTGYVKQFLENPQDIEAYHYLQEHITDLFSIDNEHFKKILETERIFTQENIVEWIQQANQLQAYEKQILLTEYKYQHLGFQEIGGNLFL